jgi:hypothetical protein
MIQFSKSKMTVDGNSIHVSMPFAKVDKERRLVSGFATLDNLDTQGDIVLAEASAKAFARARGNIREMHQPIAVGKMVDFQEEEFFHDGQLYRGIFVTARVSEGAEDTWKKVLDETLTGFSIGGEIIEFENEFVKDAGRTVRFIKDYDLTELSLVDKSATGSVTVKGMAVETEIENVFICKNDIVVIVKNSESEDCPVCGIKMENAGWFEAGSNRTDKVKEIVNKFLTPSEEAAPISEIEGGVEMSKSGETAKEVGVVNPSEEFPDGEKVEESDETSVPVEEDEEVEEVSDEEEEAETPEEVHDDESEISKKIDELHVAVKDSLEKSHNETATKVAALEEKIEKATNSFLEKTSELEKKLDEFGPKLEASKSRLAELEARLEKFNSEDAVRKSSDLEPEEKSVQKGTSWNGAFSGKSKGFSVDTLT